MVSQDEIHRMAQSEDLEERREAVEQLKLNFADLSDKEQASKELLTLTKDQNFNVQWHAVDTFGQVFQYMTDKEQALNDLLSLTKDKDGFIRMDAAFALGTAFQHVIDKEQATKELLELAKDEESVVRGGMVIALGIAFQYVTDKEHAAKKLLALIKDEDDEVRRGAASALGFAFQYLTDKEHAWKELLELIKDEDSEMRMGTAYSLGLAFQYISDKEQTIKELLELTKDGVNVVRVSANYSLGKISIYKSIEAESEDGLKEEMDKAIEYFEKSSQESEFCFNPAKFCLPFYRSYHAVIFRKEKAKEEIKRNLEEAKQDVAGSKIKGKLLEAVQNLANALEETHKLRGLNEIQSDLNAYRRYCDRACELLDSTEDAAPGAVKLMRRGLPIIDERIKGILTDIQEKSEAFCKKTKGTAYEDLGKDVYNIGQDFSNIRDGIGLEKSVENLEFALSDICSRMPEEHKGDVCKLLEKAKHEQYVEDKINTLNLVLSKIPYQIKTKPSLIESFNVPATISAFVGFIGSEFLDIIPVNYNKHIVSIVFAAIIFLFIWLFTRKKN